MRAELDNYLGLAHYTSQLSTSCETRGSLAGEVNKTLVILLPSFSAH